MLTNSRSSAEHREQKNMGSNSKYHLNLEEKDHESLSFYAI